MSSLARPDQPVLVDEASVGDLLSVADAIDVLRASYSDEGWANSVPLRRAHAAHDKAILHAVGGILPASGVAGTKTWLYTPGGASPLVVLFSLADGRLIGLVEAFALGQLRTAATTGLGTDLLARADAEVLALVGTGKQALAQAQAVATVRPLREIRVYGRDRDRLAAFAARAEALLDARIVPQPDLAQALRGADIVTTITRAGDPFVTGALLDGGMHVNAVGAIVASRGELTADAVGRCAVIAADDPVQARSDSRELREAVDAGLVAWSGVRSLADLLADPKPLRDPADITLFKALGVGLSDVALAWEVLRQARGRGLGTPLAATPEPDLVSASST